MKSFLALILCVMLLACAKDQECQSVIVETYSNYPGYWDYCRYQSNEISAEMVLASTRIASTCDGYRKGLDSTYFKSLNCPRAGELSYKINIVVK